ncbi:MAG TPA: RHS repeat-associated core domain-containing protein, partial [Mobilitalea sp.]|nr:RHS repeat-associated core domain-containing protein [Mobilitalea sp.]
NIEIPLNIEAERYQYLGQTTMLNKEYSDKGSPYSEYYTANDQVVSQKMFGLHGRITPGKEENLKTNGGLMYYQYDGGNSVTELTNRHGDAIEHYRYDAFGNIYTGVTSPYNTTTYTGQDYDDLAGLVQMDARWYDPNAGRFTSQDSYMGDIYTSQSLNRYAYVMNNPVNMWDPTGHSSSWVGDSYHFEVSADASTGDAYSLINHYDSSSGWNLIDQITTSTEITYKYQATITNTWVYDHTHLYGGKIETDPDTGATYYHFEGASYSTDTFSDTSYSYKDVVEKAIDIANRNEQYIRNLAGDPPKNTDPPAVSISTLKVGTGPVQVLNPDQIIINTSKSSERRSPITGTVQSVLNDQINKYPKVIGSFGENTAGAVAKSERTLALAFNEKLDAETVYQLESIYGWYDHYDVLSSQRDTNKNGENNIEIKRLSYSYTGETGTSGNINDKGRNNNGKSNKTKKGDIALDLPSGSIINTETLAASLETATKILGKISIPLAIIMTCDQLTAVHTDPGEIDEKGAGNTQGGNNSGSGNKNNKDNNNWGNPSTLEDHYERHGSDVNATSAQEYAQKANDFYNNRYNYEVKVDNKGITRVYDPNTNTFGSYNPDGTTRTLFSPTNGQTYFDNQPGVLIK